MGKRDLCGMEKMPSGFIAALKVAGILVISDNGMTRFLEMDAELVGSSGDGVTFEKGCFRSCAEFYKAGFSVLTPMLVMGA